MLNELLGTVAALAARAIWLAFTLVVPRTRSLLLVIGREHGKYLDNAKYFYAYVSAGELFDGEVAFLTERDDVFTSLQKIHAGVFKYPSMGAYWALLRARNIVVDNMDYMQHGRIGLIRGANIIQIWHGAPLKHIELSLHHKRLGRLNWIKRSMVTLSKIVTGRYRSVSILVSTSKYLSSHVFSKCMAAREVLPLGYPRNDVLYDDNFSSRPLIMTNVDVRALDRMTRYRRNGGKVVAYTPTFRGDPRGNEASLYLDWPALRTFCQRHDILFVLKLHPVSSLPDHLEFETQSLLVDPGSDFYPLMREIDVLVTDYSSIYIDFLHLDRPIVFYCHDLEEYQSGDRSLYFDYMEVTPGEKARSFPALMEKLHATLSADGDKYANERKTARTVFFDDSDGESTLRITRAIDLL